MWERGDDEAPPREENALTVAVKGKVCKRGCTMDSGSADNKMMPPSLHLA
jgi:hypothetical protein